MAAALAALISATSCWNVAVRYLELAAGQRTLDRLDCDAPPAAYCCPITQAHTVLTYVLTTVAAPPGSHPPFAPVGAPPTISPPSTRDLPTISPRSRRDLRHDLPTISPRSPHNLATSR